MLYEVITERLDADGYRAEVVLPPLAQEGLAKARAWAADGVGDAVSYNFV